MLPGVEDVTGRARVQADDGLGLLTRPEERLPRGLVDRGEPETLREVRERDGPEAGGRVALDLGRSDRGIRQPRKLHGNDAARIGAGPFLQMPPVVCPDASQAQLRILAGRELPSREPAHGRKADRGCDPVKVHVLYAGMDVPDALAHFLITDRLVSPVG